MKLRRVFGNNIRNYRTSLKLSQEKFAELCGLHRTYISDIECFQRNISIDIIEKISVALGIDAYMLLRENANLFHSQYKS